MIRLTHVAPPWFLTTQIGGNVGIRQGSYLS
jgi:hypothetical protein